LPAPVEYEIRLLAVSPITLVSEAAAPDEYEPEACFDRMGVLEMDAGVAKADPIGISSGLSSDPLGATSDGAGLGEVMSGAAIDFGLTRIRIRRYPSFDGGRLL
jgi:hypothetical protein